MSSAPRSRSGNGATRPAQPKSGGKKPDGGQKLIADNRKARFDYHIEDQLEAGIALEGWEVKSLRAGKANITEAYAVFRDGEIWLMASHITPLSSASTHVEANPTRLRKLLLHRREIDRLMGSVDRQGYTLVPLSLYWHQGRAKVKLGLAKGKQSHDKRASIKERDWQRQKGRLMRKGR
jgi:SsrA-binding protein